mmetsp:Transcript_25431/g.33204  ORF Transcript_25431/g.33204 Transcript_25431/m.33204 type:complete len:377 (+) Transcript_25431:107-1237(+)
MTRDILMQVLTVLSVAIPVSSFSSQLSMGKLGLQRSMRIVPRSFNSYKSTLSMNSQATVLFDFDGTIGDTETPAMQIAFWELAPYFPSAEANGVLPDETKYVQDNAGKAFEFMIEVVEKDRTDAGLVSIEDARGKENPSVMKVVNDKRKSFGLKTFDELISESGSLPDLLMQQKDETVQALSKVSQPNPGVSETLKTLKELKFPFAIATTSPKPRVPVSITSCGFDEYFPAGKVWSGESDFDPPRFKPDPSVYLLAAEKESQAPEMCIAVEDSASGVGSASNANIGLIVGYVGSSHIPPEKKDSHSEELMAGTRAENGRGAELVIMDFTDLISIVQEFQKSKDLGESAQQLNERLLALRPTFTGSSWYNPKIFALA